MPQKFINDPEASLVLVQRLYTEFESRYKDGTDNKLNKYIKAEQTLMAAFPLHDLEDEVKEAEEDEEEECRWPEGSFEIIKNLMREYFPWRIDGDEIRYFDDFDMDEIKEFSKKIKDNQKPESEE